MIKKNRGITLIALVVTIIVLIILATVSINMVVGENGLIRKAEQARDAYEESSKREEEGLDSMVEEYDYLMELRKLPKGPTGKPLVEGLTEIQKRTVKAEDENGKEVTVPKGFKVVPECGADVNDGIVIEDEDGNQFVWVPCTEEQYKKHEYHTKNIDDRDKNLADDGNGNWKTVDYRYYTDWTDEGGGDASSIKENGGFYVGRYEAGVPDNAPFSISKNNGNDLGYYTIEGVSHTFPTNYVNDNTTKARGSTADKDSIQGLKPVSKQGMQVWNYISQENAVTVSKNMYSGAESSYGVTSQLIDGIAWDRIVDWLGESYTNIAAESSTHGNYSNNPMELTENVLYAQHVYATVKNGQTGETGWIIANKYKKGQPKLGGETLTNYTAADYTNGDKYNSTTHTLSKKVELATGSVSDFKLKNIYDIAGNIWEWTTEAGYHSTSSPATTTGTKYAVSRGGSYNDGSSVDPISSRHGNAESTRATLYTGFRVMLYVK